MNLCAPILTCSEHMLLTNNEEENRLLSDVFHVEFISLIFAQILMKFCRNFADALENVEFFEFS